MHQCDGCSNWRINISHVDNRAWHSIRYVQKGTCIIIIELVDSVCRDTTDTQLKLIQKNLPKSLQISKTGGKKAFMTTYYSSSSVFLAQKTPSVVNNRRESTAPKSRQTAKIGFLLLHLLLSSDGLVQIWLTPSRRCLHKTAAFYTEQCTTPSLFGYFEVSQGA